MRANQIYTFNNFKSGHFWFWWYTLKVEAEPLDTYLGSGL